MKPIFLIIFLCAFIFFSQPAMAKTLTAVCKNIKGRTYGLSLNGTDIEDRADGMGENGLVTISWDMDTKKATFVTLTQGDLANRGETSSNEEFVINNESDFVSFALNEPRASFLDTLNFKTRKILMSKHSSYYGYILMGDCTIEFN